MGIEFQRAKVGDRYVLAMLKEHGGVLGGETSGHMICLDRTTTGDGLISALQVLAVMRAAGSRWRAGRRHAANSRRSWSMCACREAVRSTSPATPASRRPLRKVERELGSAGGSCCGPRAPSR